MCYEYEDDIYAFISVFILWAHCKHTTKMQILKSRFHLYSSLHCYVWVHPKLAGPKSHGDSESTMRSPD